MKPHICLIVPTQEDAFDLGHSLSHCMNVWVYPIFVQPESSDDDRELLLFAINLFEQGRSYLPQDSMVVMAQEPLESTEQTLPDFYHMAFRLTQSLSNGWAIHLLKSPWWVSDSVDTDFECQTFDDVAYFISSLVLAD